MGRELYLRTKTYILGTNGKNRGVFLVERGKNIMGRRGGKRKFHSRFFFTA